MSKYTTELRYICESLAGLDNSAGYEQTENIIDKATPLIFSFEFPIFDSDYKIPLCQKIIEHYYNREIGAESYGLWRLQLRTKMREIMPYYNQLYKSAQLTFDPLQDTDTKTTHTLKRDESETHNDTRETSGKSSGSSKTSGTETSRAEQDYSDTPQGDSTGVLDKKYLTTVTVDNSNSNTSGTQETESTTSGTDASEGARAVKSTDEYIEQIAGKRGGQSYSALLTEFRETMLNIDMMIIDELSDLFINLW